MSCPQCAPYSTPCPENSGLICNPNYLSMLEVPRLRLLGVPTGAYCQQFLQRKRGFIFDDGTGLGQFVSDAPELTLPIINPEASGTYSTAPGFPFFVVGTGGNPHGWRFVRGKTGEAQSIVWDGNYFIMQAVGAQPGLVTVCSGGGSASIVGLIGCVQTGLDGDGNPVYAMRKLSATGTDKRPMVGYTDGDGNPQFQALPTAEILAHPLGKFSDTLRLRKIQGLNADGTDTAGGLPVLETYGAGAVTDAEIVFYSPTTKLIYKAPAGYVNSATLGSITLTADTWANIQQWTNIVLNYSTILVSFSIAVNLPKKIEVEVLVNGVIKQNFKNYSVAEQTNTLAGIVILGGIVPGVNSIVIRAKAVTVGGTIGSGVVAITTLAMP